jgi:hypothetical protein
VDKEAIDVGWRVEFTDPTLQQTAATIVDGLRTVGASVGPAKRKPAQDATLGTPEIIITIVVTAAAKAIIVAGLQAIERILEGHLRDPLEKRAQVILNGPGHERQRFPVSLQKIGKEALNSQR